MSNLDNRTCIQHTSSHNCYILFTIFILVNNKMLATSSSNSKSSYNSSSNLIPCWPALEAALERLLPLNYETETTEVLVSEDYLKLYTLVFDYCVGNSSLNEKSTDKKPTNSSGTQHHTLFMYFLIILIFYSLHVWRRFILCHRKFFE